MIANEYGVCISDMMTRKYTENLVRQIQLIWETMWYRNEIKGRTTFSITKHGVSYVYGNISFDLPLEKVDVSVNYIRNGKGIEDVFEYQGRVVELLGLKSSFIIEVWMSEQKK